MGVRYHVRCNTCGVDSDDSFGHYGSPFKQSRALLSLIHSAGNFGKDAYADEHGPIVYFIQQHAGHDLCIMTDCGWEELPAPEYHL